MIANMHPYIAELFVGDYQRRRLAEAGQWRRRRPLRNRRDR